MTSCTLLEEVERFTKAITEIKDSIVNIKGDNYIRYRKALLFSLIDLMGKTASGTDNNRKRFTYFVLDFCDWKQANLISLPQLALVLEQDKGDTLEVIREYTYRALSKWCIYDYITIERDPHYDCLKGMWPHGCKVRVKKKKIGLDYLKHVNLLWRMRNSLIHELRVPGKSVDIMYKLDFPHYISVGKLFTDSKGMPSSSDHGSWELVYPEKFMLRLIDNGLEKLRISFLNEGISPFKNFSFDPLWLDQ